MPLTLTRTVAPVAEPLALQTVKDHCRVYISDDDSLLTALITAARDYVERFIQRQIITATWQLCLDYFPTDGRPIELPRPPLASVSSITYVDQNNTTQTLSASTYTVDTFSEPGRLWPAYGQFWPSTQIVLNSIIITYVAGFDGTGTLCPQAIKQAMLLLIGGWYENRESVITDNRVATDVVPMGVEALLSAYDVGRIF